jgi:hypothetical protein
MWSVVRFTAQKGHPGLGSLSITAEWVALVYPVRKRLISTCSRWCSLCGVFCALWWLWSSFPIFLVALVRVFLLSMLSSPVGNMFRCGEFPRSVILLLSAASFPGIPTWLGTHSNVIFVDAWSISFRINWVFGFLDLFPSEIAIIVLSESAMITRFWL